MGADTNVLIIAVFSLVLGLAIYLGATRLSKGTYFNSFNIVGWLLVALFPALVLFAFFPSSQANGTIFGLTVSGAAAVFFVIWWYGIRHASKALWGR